MKNAALVAVMAALGVSLAVADEVHLANGRKIVGIASREDQKILVEVGAGTITFDAKDVSSIDPGRTALHEYAEKWNAVKDSRKASDLWDLALWARSNSLYRHVTPLALKVVDLDADHMAARAELRHEKIGGKWLTFEQAQEYRGLKWIGDRWVTLAEVQLIERRRLDAKERAAARELEREERRAEELRRRQMAIDEYNARMSRWTSDLDGYFHQPSAFWPPHFRPYWWAPYVRSRRHYQYGSFDGGAVGTYDLFRFVQDPYLKKK